MISSDILGADYFEDRKCKFCVWAPLVKKIEVHVIAPEDKIIPMRKDEWGYHSASSKDIEAGSLYFYRLDEAKELPDPASRSQPQGVHGPSEVVNLSYKWEDPLWNGPTLEKYIIYELHVGTFTPRGTFDAIIPRLNELKKLGITAIELMPVAQFSGNRNWGYDGVYPFAVQNTYGGYYGFQEMVNACHKLGLAVVLDVVYNHLGPEGNYLKYYGPYFTGRYNIPWGEALNFDGPESDEVCRFFISNALCWVKQFHIDCLRLDAIHAIIEQSPKPFVEKLATAVHRAANELSRNIYVIAESNLNDARLIETQECGGYGLDALWNDDFHHSLHTLLTGERDGYYQDFGKLQHMIKAFREGFVYSGQYTPFWKRQRGTSSKRVSADHFVVFSQNHDQVGNRLNSERLSCLVSFEALKLSASVVLFSPFIPLIFMGEEYGETAPFLYFVSHSDPSLIDAVRKGRCDEFACFEWRGEVPDPQAEATFLESKLDWDLKQSGNNLKILNFYSELIRLRKELPALSFLSKEHMDVVGFKSENVLYLRRWNGDNEIFALFNLGKEFVTVSPPVPQLNWQKGLDSAMAEWGGPGSILPDKLGARPGNSLTVNPYSMVLYQSAT